MRLLFIACVCTLSCAPTITWAAKPSRVLSLAKIERRAAEDQKQKAEQAEKQRTEEERRKSMIERDLENYEQSKDKIQQWFGHAAEIRLENLTWDQRMVKFSKLLSNDSPHSYLPRLSSKSAVEALAINLATAYQGNPAEGLGEMVAAGYRNQPAATTAALQDLTEDTLALVTTIVRSAHTSQKKQLELLRAFSAKFSEHAQMALPELQGPAANAINDHVRVKFLLTEEKIYEQRKELEENLKRLRDEAPKKIENLLIFAQRSLESQSEPELRIADLIKSVPGTFDVEEAEIYLEELSGRTSTAIEPRETEAIALVAQAIALKTKYDVVGALRRGRLIGASIYLTLTAVLATTASYFGLADHAGGALVTAVIITVPAALAFLNLCGINSTHIIPHAEPFVKPMLERANQRQTEKMLSYFDSRCDSLLKTPSNVRVAVPKTEIVDEEFTAEESQEEPEKLKQRSLR